MAHYQAHISVNLVGVRVRERFREGGDMMIVCGRGRAIHVKKSLCAWARRLNGHDLEVPRRTQHRRFLCVCVFLKTHTCAHTGRLDLVECQTAASIFESNDDKREGIKPEVSSLT